MMNHENLGHHYGMMAGCFMDSTNLLISCATWIMLESSRLGELGFAVSFSSVDILLGCIIESFGDGSER